MKLTKATLKRLIKEELQKEARNLGRPPRNTIKHGGATHYSDIAPTQQEREAKQRELIDQAMDFGAMMSGEFDGLNIDDPEQIQNTIQRLSKEFKMFIGELYQFANYHDKRVYYLDDEDYEYEDPGEQAHLDRRRRSALSPKQRTDLQESRRRTRRRK